MILSRDKKMNETEKRIRDKESQVSQLLDKNKKISTDFERKSADYDHKLEFVERKENELEKIHTGKTAKLIAAAVTTCCKWVFVNPI